MIAQLTHQRREQGRQIIVYVCAVIMLLQLMANAVGMHYDHSHQENVPAIQSISLDVGFPDSSLHNCGGYSHCHGNLPAFIVSGSFELLTQDATTALLPALNLSIPAPPFSTLFKPPIA